MSESHAESKSLWCKILAETSQQAKRATQVEKTLLVLGNRGTGKSTLIAALQQTKNSFIHSAGLKYAYLSIRDEYHDELARLSVWLHAEELLEAKLLRFALNESNYEHATVMIVLSMAEPWRWRSQLSCWLQVLKAHIESLHLAPVAYEAAKKRLIAKWHEYVDECVWHASTPKKRTSNEHTDKLFEELSAEQTPGLLELNYGLPIIVVVTKTDVMSNLAWHFDYDDAHFDFIQKWLREQCLRIGASLIYTSAKAQNNCVVLLNYLTASIYALPKVVCVPQVLERDLIFVPAGWDTYGKINILNEQLSDFQQHCTYEAFVQTPVVKCAMPTAAATKTDMLLDEQTFFANQLQEVSDEVLLSNATPQPTLQTEKPVAKKKSPNCAKSLEKFFNELLVKKTTTDLSRFKARESSVAIAEEQTPPTESIAETLKRLSK